VVRISAQEIIAQTPADKVGVLADKAQARALREVALQQGAGIYVPQRARSFAAKLIDEFGEDFNFSPMTS